jgi:uncharacterized membrane protein YbhN (UPF0104 family)
MASLPTESSAAASLPLTAAPPSRLRAAWTGWPGRLLRLLLAVLPLVWLFRRVDASLVATRAVQVGPRGLLLALLAGGGSLCVGAVRWRVLLGAYGADPARIPPVLSLLRHNMVGQYFSVLPTGVAGEAVRGFRVGHCFPRPSTSYVVLFIERIAGLMGLLLIAGAAALASPALRGGPVAFAMNLGVALALSLGTLVFVLPQLAARLPRLQTQLARLPLAGSLLANLPVARTVRGPLLAVALSVLSQLCVVLTVAALLGPLAPAATLAVCARVVPAIVLITYIPLTPGGLGQREAAFVHFFGLVHIEREAAMAASLLFFAVMLALSVLGGLVLLYERARGSN